MQLLKTQSHKISVLGKKFYYFFHHQRYNFSKKNTEVGPNGWSHGSCCSSLHISIFHTLCYEWPIVVMDETVGYGRTGGLVTVWRCGSDVTSCFRLITVIMFAVVTLTKGSDHLEGIYLNYLGRPQISNPRT